MDRLRRRLTALGAIIIVIMVLFPPFHVEYSPAIEIEKGYAFIFNPPVFWGKTSTVDMTLLSLQLGTVVAIMAAIQLLYRMYRK